MTISTFLVHFGNFVAPALTTSLLLALVPLGGRKAGWIGAYGRRFTLLFAVGVSMLVLGLLFFSRDGRMATYAMLVVAQGTLMWLWQLSSDGQLANRGRVKRSRAS